MSEVHLFATQYRQRARLIAPAQQELDEAAGQVKARVTLRLAHHGRFAGNHAQTNGTRRSRCATGNKLTMEFEKARRKKVVASFVEAVCGFRISTSGKNISRLILCSIPGFYEMGFALIVAIVAIFFFAVNYYGSWGATSEARMKEAAVDTIACLAYIVVILCLGVIAVLLARAL